MNILPKKRWHVRTKSNIERVRRDEAEALAREQQQERRVQLAKQEARIELLRNKTPNSKSTKEDDSSCVLGDPGSSDATNKEHEEEKKNEQEKFEKRIGLLNCLGQSVEKEPWYLKPREKPATSNKFKEKNVLDPLHQMQKYLTVKKLSGGHIEKSSQPKSSKAPVPHESGVKSVKSFQQLREMREQREKRERERARQLLEKQ